MATYRALYLTTSPVSGWNLKAYTHLPLTAVLPGGRFTTLKTLFLTSVWYSVSIPANQCAASGHDTASLYFWGRVGVPWELVWGEVSAGACAMDTLFAPSLALDLVSWGEYPCCLYFRLGSCLN